MLYKTQKINSDIRFALSFLTTDIKLNSLSNYNHKAKVSENIFGVILSKIFNENFIQTDLQIGANYPAIDLISKDIAFQISANDSTDKIKKTIHTFNKHIESGTYDVTFKKIQFLLITDKKSFNSNSFTTETSSKFNPKEDIYFTSTLVKEIEKISPAKQKEIRDYLWDELYLSDESYKLKGFKAIMPLDLELDNLSNNVKPYTTIVDFENELLFYTKDEKNAIEVFKDRLNFVIPIPFLITGHPTSGKSTTAFKIVKEVSVKDGIVPYYFNTKDDSDFNLLFDDLNKIGRFPSFLIVDNIHRNIELGIRIIKENRNYKNIIFIFVSNYISDDYRLSNENVNIYEDLKDRKLSLEVFNSKSYYRDKIEGTVQSFKKYLQRNNKNPREGGILHIEFISNKNLLKLKLLLNLWCIDDEVLSNIQNSNINNELFNTFLKDLTPEEYIEIMEFASINSFDVIFEKINNTKKLKTESKGLFYTDEDFKSLFMHPSFCELLIDAYLFKEKRLFQTKYKNDKNLFKFNNIESYFAKFADDVYGDVSFILISLFINAGRNRDFYMLNNLIDSNITYDHIIKFFKFSSDANAIQLKSIIQLTKLIGEKKIEKLINDLIIENKNILNVLKNGNDGLYTLSFIHYAISPKNKHLKRLLIDRFSSNDILLLINNCLNHKLALSILNFKDLNYRNQIFRLVPTDKWKLIFENIHFNLIGNTLTELKKINKNLANELYDLLKPVNVSTEYNNFQFDKLAKNLSELKTFEKEVKDSKSKLILNMLNIEDVCNSMFKASVLQLATGLSQLKKIDNEFAISLLNNYKIESIYALIKENANLNDIALVLNNISNISSEKALQIVGFLENEKTLNPFFNSKKIKGSEIALILNTLNNVGDKSYGSKILIESNKDIIKGRLISNTPDISLMVLKSINLYDSTLAKKLLSDYLKEDIISKINKPIFTLSQISSFLTSLKILDKSVCYNFYSKIENILIIKKSLNRNVNFNQIATYLSNTKNCNKEKTIDLYRNLYAHNIFHNKAKETTIKQFVHCIITLNEIDQSLSKKLIISYCSQTNINLSNIITQLKLNNNKLWEVL